MLEWKGVPNHPESLRLETETRALDVFPRMQPSYDGLRKMYNYLVYDKTAKHYLDNGFEYSQDKACEAALKAAGL